MTDSLKEYLKMNDVEFKERVNLSGMSSVKIGALARLVLYPKNEEMMILIVSHLSNLNID